MTFPVRPFKVKLTFHEKKEFPSSTSRSCDKMELLGANDLISQKNKFLGSTDDVMIKLNLQAQLTSPVRKSDFSV